MIGVVVNFDPVLPTGNIINIKYDIFVLIITLGSIMGLIMTKNEINFQRKIKKFFNGVEKINFSTINKKNFLILFFLSIDFVFLVLIVVPVFLLLVDLIIGSNESACFENIKLLKIAIAAIPYFIFSKKIKKLINF